MAARRAPLSLWHECGRWRSQKTGADSCRALNGRLHGDVFDDSAASCFGKLDFLVRHDLDLAIVRAPMPTSPSPSHSCEQAGSDACAQSD